jgi:hypothetical protein
MPNMTFQCTECAVVFPSKELANCDDCTSPSMIQRWQQNMFIFSCLLYDEGYETVLDDPGFDSLTQYLLKWYDQDGTPDFKARVSQDQLRAGTGLGLVYTDLERAAAIEWFERVKGRKPDNVNDL